MDDHHRGHLTLLPVASSQSAEPAEVLFHTSPPSAGDCPVPILIAEQLYRHLRPQYPDRPATLAAVIDALIQHRSEIHPEAPPGDIRALTAWAKDYGWEQTWLREQVKAELGAEPSSPLARLREVKDVLDDIHTALQKLAYELTKPDAVGPKSADALRKMWQTYSDAMQEWITLDANARRSMEESTSTPEFKEAVDSLYGDLLERYAHLGPQYDILCRTLAIATVQIEQRLKTSRAVPPKELTDLYDLQTKVTAQLQRHTEATKSESLTQDRREMLTKLMEIIYNEVKQQPELAARILNTVSLRLGAGTLDLTAEEVAS